MFGEQHGIGRSVVIPNGADEREFDRPAAGFRQWAGIDTRYLVITVANHYTSKGHAFVIDAFRRLGRADVTLAIVGRMPRNPLRGCGTACRLAALRDRRVRLFPDLPREWVVSALKEADLFVFGSRIECAPLVIYEAFASRLPVISTPVGNYPTTRDWSRSWTPWRERPGRWPASWAMPADGGKWPTGDGLWRDRRTWESIALSYEREYARLLSA